MIDWCRRLAFAALPLSLIAGCGAANAPAQPSNHPPNVVIFLTDDQGYADVGCYGAKGFVTPRLDQMAAEGMRFTDLYTPAPVCTPTRAGIMTGRHPQRLGLMWIEHETMRGDPAVVLYALSKHGLAVDEITLPQLLKTRGYTTAAVGKWHLGDAPEFLPTRRGFDSYFGIPYSNDMNPSILMRDEKIIEQPVNQDTLVERYTDEAVKFIHTNKDKPFFLYFAHNSPHVPLHVGARWKGKTERGLYGDVIESIDWSAGEVLDALKREGLDDQTLMVFTSDNGPWYFHGEAGGSATPLRGGKGTTYDGGMRVPFIARWPGHVPAGRVCNEMLTQLDLFPTIAGLCGATVPNDRKIDGADIAPILLGQQGTKSPNEAIYFYGEGKLNAVRSGVWKLKLQTTLQEETYYGKYESPDAKIPAALYNLDYDPGEQKNVATDHPDIVARLQKLADDMRVELGDRRQNVIGKGVRPIGEVPYSRRPFHPTTKQSSASVWIWDGQD